MTSTVKEVANESKDYARKVGDIDDRLSMHIHKLYEGLIDSNKCAFGHFYNAINIHNEEIQNEWNSIRDIHKNFHGLGSKVMTAIENQNMSQTAGYLKEADELSRRMLAVLDALIDRITTMSAANVRVF